MFSNRLKKNLKTIGKWAKKQKITCYRLYDADMPEFAVAIDVYFDDSETVWLHVQEYAAPKSIDETTSLERLREALAVLPACLSVNPNNIVLKRCRYGFSFKVCSNWETTVSTIYKYGCFDRFYRIIQYSTNSMNQWIILFKQIAAFNDTKLTFVFFGNCLRHVC